MFLKSLILTSVLLTSISAASAADLKSGLPKTTLASLVQHNVLPKTAYASLVKEAVYAGKADDLYGHEGTYGPPIFALPEPSVGESEAMNAAIADSKRASEPEAAPWADAE
jgi:hypothetical protein